MKQGFMCVIFYLWHISSQKDSDFGALQISHIWIKMLNLNAAQCTYQKSVLMSFWQQKGNTIEDIKF